MFITEFKKDDINLLHDIIYNIPEYIIFIHIIFKDIELKFYNYKKDPMYIIYNKKYCYSEYKNKKDLLKIYDHKKYNENFKFILGSKNIN